MDVMTTRSLTSERLRGVGLFAIAASSVLLTCGLAASQAAGADRDTAPHETFSNPPGLSAHPVSGSPAAEPFRFQTFISRQVNVGADGADIVGDAANEPSIAVDPTHPNHMVIGWRQFATTTSNFREAGYAYTRDGGLTWTFPGVLEDGVFRSDPVLDCDADGNFYYLGLTMTRPPEAITRTCHLFKSSNGGLTWSPAVFAYGGDKEWMAIDRSDGPGRGHIYSSWNPNYSDFGEGFFTRSVDGGASFEFPIAMPAVPLFGTMVVDDEGMLLIAGKEAAATGDAFSFLRSADARNPLVTPTFTTTTFQMGGVLLNGAAYPPSPNPDGWLGQVWIDIDRSGGPRDGNVYVLCSVDPPDVPGIYADPLDIHFVRSEDGGATWSAPVRVNDDPVGNGAWQWFGTMSVAPNGRIDAVWNDTRNTLLSTYSQLFYAFSNDGGVTWSPNQPCSGIWGSYLGFPSQNKIGDYYDTHSDLVGVDVAWAATFNGGQDIYYLRIGDHDCNGNGIGDPADIGNHTSADDNLNGIPDECEDTPADVAVLIPDAPPGVRCVPNPFNPATTITFELHRPRHIILSVHDAAGRRLATLLDEDRPAGIGTAIWNAAGQASGVYFVRLETAGVTRLTKVVLLKWAIA